MIISLAQEMETLLIPLYGRAMMSAKGIFKDADAENAIEKIDFDFSKLKIQEKTQVMLSLRGMLIDDFTTAYADKHPESTVIYLGCGLDSRVRRLKYPVQNWYDLDFPQVIDIRRQLWAETERNKYLPSSVTEWGWLDTIEDNRKPVLVIAEGLMMYLRENDIKALFMRLKEKFGEVTLIFDVFSRTTAKNLKQHPSLKETGATICWGVDSSQDIEAYGEGIKHIKTLYLTDDCAIARLPKKYHMIFKLAGKFKMAREAHRIFIMEIQGKLDQ